MSNTPVVDRIELFPLHVPFRAEVRETMARSEGGLGMARVQQQVEVPLMAHEGCFSLGDFLALADLGAARAGVLGHVGGRLPSMCSTTRGEV